MVRSNLEISHSRVGSLKRIFRPIFCIPKEYEVVLGHGEVKIT